jgi:predicted ATPase
MSETLDAEDVTSVMNRVWERLDAAVIEHGGRIDKHIGDALMAVWGAQTAREDDPEQAVRAALVQQAALAELRAEAGFDLAIRVGVNTGPVLLGAVGSTGEFTAMGDTVNVASRLEHAAPLHGVLVSHDTYRHVRGVFTVEAQQPLTVKGKLHPLRTYLVTAVRPRAFRLSSRGVEGVETRMIGREADLEQLQGSLTRCRRDRVPSLALVVGDAGVGKSRLLYEFEDWLRIQPVEVRLFTARADQRFAGSSHFLFRDLLFSRFGIADDDPPQRVLDLLAAGMAELAPATTAREVALVATLVGVQRSGGPVPDSLPSDPQVLIDQAVTALAKFMQHLAAEMPVVVLAEDLHWADQASLSLLESLLARCPTSPLFVLGLARPILFERATRWPVDPGDMVTINLDPLNDQVSRLLVEEVLQKVETIPNDLLERITTTAAGNPFFLEELVKMMVDDGTIVIEVDAWAVNLEALGHAQPPATVTAVLQARLDHLDARHCGLLERAAVVGRIFWDDAIPDLRELGITESQDVAEVLDFLEARELIFRQSSSAFHGAGEYIFKHALLHDVAYDRVLKRDRARLHRSVAEWLTQRTDAPGAAATVATHYDAAGDAAQAARWHARAGQHAVQQYALDDAVDHFQAARRTGELDADTELSVLEQLSATLTTLARYDDGLDVARHMLDLATELDDQTWQAAALMEHSMHLTRLGRLHEALAACDQSHQLLSRANSNTDLQARVLTERGWILLRLGHLSDAVTAGMQALALASGVTGLNELRCAHSQLGSAYAAAWDLDAAEHHLQQALLLDRDTHNTRNESGDLINLGVIASQRGDHHLAITRYHEALRLQREIGDRDQEALTLSNLGGAHLELRDHTTAVDLLTQALQLFDAAHASEHTSETHRHLAEAHLGLRNLDRALAEARTSLLLAEHSGSADHLGHAWLTLGHVARRFRSPIPVSNDADRDAQACFHLAISTFAQADMATEHARALQALENLNRPYDPDS